MDNFLIYFGLGRDHILDYTVGLDHILFIVALCALYTMRDWKQVLVLVTAFTIGHSITLALSTFRIINVDFKLTEFLIPLTIFVTAVSNLFKNENNISRSNFQINYYYAAIFGLIHGLGFSNQLRTILGKNENIASSLLAFNIGLEFGQIIIVGIFLTACFLLVDLFGLNRRDWKMVISSAVAGMALLLMNERNIFD